MRYLFQRNRVLCLVWWAINFIFVGLSLLSNVRGLVSGGPQSGTPLTFPGLFLQCYFLWVVFAFTLELKKEAESAPETKSTL